MKKTDILYHKNITLEQALCGGNFFIHLQNGKRVKVNINPGINDGQIIRLKELGQITGGQKGDLLIALKILDHPIYKLTGLDLNAKLIVTPAEAELGSDKTMPGPDGKKISVKVPPKSKTGSTVCIKNAGIRKNDQIGDIIFELVIEDVITLNTLLQSTILTDQKGLLN